MDIRDVLHYGLSTTHARVNRCLEDLTEEEARRSPAEGLSPVVWQVGHIALTDLTFAHRAGRPAQEPPGYAGLFQMGTGGETAYPPLHEIRQALIRAQQALQDVSRTADLDAAVDARSYSTVGEMLAFAIYHRGYHVGKITTLRALLQKPRLFG